MFSIITKPHHRKFFKDIDRARAFCNKVNGSLHKRGSANYNVELDYVEFPEDYEEFEYVVIWREEQ